MKLYEAYDRAYFTLNSGGVPVVLSRCLISRRDIRDFEVRMRWTGPKDRFSSDRGPIIVESRKRTNEGWLEWRLNATPFGVGDLDDFTSTWSVRYPDHRGRSGFPCPRCAEEELRTDNEMVVFYGPCKTKHTCGLRAFEEAE